MQQPNMWIMCMRMLLGDADYIDDQIEAIVNRSFCGESALQSYRTSGSVLGRRNCHLPR